MNPDHYQLLTLTTLPARVNATQAAQLLGFLPHELSLLMAAGLLKPLGRPAPNSIKYFATADLEALRRDTQWLSKATDAVQHHWRQKNHTAPPAPARRRRSNLGQPLA